MPTRQTSVTNPDSKTIGYQYDAGGNRTRLTDPNGGITYYVYDDDNRLAEVNAPCGITTYEYDSLGRQVLTEYPNGTYTEYAYDPNRNWLISLTNKAPNDTVLSSFTYTYDDVGNRLSVTENGGSAVSYEYDDIYQLTSETRTGSNAYTITYQYDAAGNRTQMVKNSVTTSYTYNSKNQLLTETAGGTTINYTYDLNGNLTQKSGGGSTTTYDWDWRNMLTSVSSMKEMLKDFWTPQNWQELIGTAACAACPFQKVGKMLPEDNCPTDPEFDPDGPGSPMPEPNPGDENPNYKLPPPLRRAA